MELALDISRPTKTTCQICGKEVEHDANIFVAVIQDGDGKTVRLALKWTDVRQGDVPTFTYQRGTWFIAQGMEKWINGHATWFYNYDDARPLAGGRRK